MLKKLLLIPILTALILKRQSIIVALEMARKDYVAFRDGGIKTTESIDIFDSDGI